MLSQGLFERPDGAESRRSSAANGHGNGQEGITPPPDALVHEKSMAEGDNNAPLKNLPYPFPGFGPRPRDSNEQEQVPFSPSPAVPEESTGGRDDEEEEAEAGRVIRTRGRGRGRRRGGSGRRLQSPVKRGTIIVFRPCIQLAFESWPAYSQPLPIRIPSPSPRGQHVIHRLTSLRLLACYCDTTKQEYVNSGIARDA